MCTGTLRRMQSHVLANHTTTSSRLSTQPLRPNAYLWRTCSAMALVPQERDLISPKALLFDVYVAVQVAQLRARVTTSKPPGMNQCDVMTNLAPTTTFSRISAAKIIEGDLKARAHPRPPILLWISPLQHDDSNAHKSCHHCCYMVMLPVKSTASTTPFFKLLLDPT